MCIQVGLLHRLKEQAELHGRVTVWHVGHALRLRADSELCVHAQHLLGLVPRAC